MFSSSCLTITRFLSVLGKSCLKTELQFSDMYLLMAAHVYIDLWMETGEVFYTHLCWKRSCFLVIDERVLCRCCRWSEQVVAESGAVRGRSLQQFLQRSVQTAAFASVLSTGGFWAGGRSLLQSGRQTRPARHHRVRTYLFFSMLKVTMNYFWLYVPGQYINAPYSKF